MKTSFDWIRFGNLKVQLVIYAVDEQKNRNNLCLWGGLYLIFLEEKVSLMDSQMHNGEAN